MLLPGVGPSLGPAYCYQESHSTYYARASISYGARLRVLQQAIRSALCDLLELDTFERFVIVITLIERYADQDCALLLGCGRSDIVVTRAMALRKLSRRAVSESQTQEVNETWQSIWPGRKLKAIAATLEH